METAWDMFRRLWEKGKKKQICTSFILQLYKNGFWFLLQKKIKCRLWSNFIWNYSEKEAIMIMQLIEKELDKF